MQKPIHPHRYRETMSAAIARLEHIAAGTDSTARLEIEFSDLTPVELGERRQFLNHIERLIANWISDGCQAFDAVTLVDNLVEGKCRPFVLEGELGDSVTYVHFGKTDLLALKSPQGLFIEGFYFHGIVSAKNDALQITFVCNGPEWIELEQRPYGQALRVASQIAICTVSIGSVLPDALDENILHGDSELTLDNVMPLARNAVGNLLAILQAKSGLTVKPYLGPLH